MPWEGRTEAETREPGDLPRQHNVLGRGVPVVRLRCPSRARRWNPMPRRASALPPTYGVSHVSFPLLSCRYSRHAAHRSAPRTENSRSKATGRANPTKRRCLTPLRICAPPTGRARSRSASPSFRRTISRSTIMCSTPASWSARSPTIYGWKGGPVSLATYFAMARGAKATIAA